MHDITVLIGERGSWASPPSKPRINADGTVQKTADGKIIYSPIIEFASREVRIRWSDAVIDALRTAHSASPPAPSPLPSATSSTNCATSQHAWDWCSSPFFVLLLTE